MDRMSEQRAPPPLKKGWMEKQSRKGVMRNWKKRFFVLAQGKISYYVDETATPPYGDNLKGEMNLVNTELVEESAANDKQIFVASFNGENSLLMEAESGEDAKQWARAIRAHIAFANRDTEKIVARHMSMPLSSSSTSASSAAVGGAGGVSASSSTKTESARPASTPVPTSGKGLTATSTSASATAATATATNNNTTSSAASTAAAAPTATTTPTQPSSAPSPSASSPPEKLLEASECFDKLVDFVTRISVDSAFRESFLKGLLPSLQSACASAMTNLQEGQPGERGEMLLSVALLLFFVILLGFVPRLLWAINLALRLLAVLMILAGIAMVVSAAIQLKSNFSFVLTPSPKNEVVRTGLYALVRHPMYGGMVLVAFGRAIISDRAYQVLLAVALAIVLNLAADKEEEFLEKKHPREYPLYASKRKVLVPFLY